MYCARCGYELKDNVRFCPQCGSPVDSTSEEGVSDTDEIMHAEQEQEENASAQLQNEPASFSTVMDETKTRSKRRIPIAVIVALALALAVGAAFAGYYIYTTYAASQQEEQTKQTTDSQESNEESEERSETPVTEQIEEQPGETEETESEEPVGEESEETSEEQSEVNPAYDESMAAYGGVLDEYLAFMDFVNGGGDVNSLERDPETYALIDYPHVNDAFTYDTFENIDCNQYAYVDLDDNGIPELVVGDGSNQPIEVYTYSDGAVVNLFGITGARDWWFIDANGNIINDGSGGIAQGRTIYVLNDSNLEPVDTVDLDYEDSGLGNNEYLYVIRHTTADGVDETETTYDYDEALEIMSRFSAGYTVSSEKIALDWQDL